MVIRWSHVMSILPFATRARRLREYLMTGSWRDRLAQVLTLILARYAVNSPSSRCLHARVCTSRDVSMPGSSAHTRWHHVNCAGHRAGSFTTRRAVQTCNLANRSAADLFVALDERMPP